MFKNFENSYLLNRNSDENVFYMKVAQKDETNPNTQSVRTPLLPNLSNTQLPPPPVHLPEYAKHREYFPGCFPPLLVSPIPALDHPWHRVLPCYIL